MALSVSVKITKNTMVRDLRSFRREMGKSVEQIIDRGTREMHSSIRSRQSRKTGELVDSYVRIARPTFGIVGSRLLRARFAEFGTKRGQVGNRVVELAVLSQGPTFRRRIVQAARRAAR
jgi:hypothetical protein